MTISRKLPLLVVVGTTASGKTRLSVELAKRFDGEVISADSRTIYRGLSVGTAKPTFREMDGVPHWAIDIVDPDEKFTVADFQKYAERKIREIRARGKLPILVGGSGLYVDSVIFDYDFSRKNKASESGDFAKNEIREKFAGKTVEELQDFITEHKIYMPENSRNRRYLLREIEKHYETNEVEITTNNRDKIRENTIIVGIELDKKVVRERIEKRIHEMFSTSELECETKENFAKYATEFFAKYGQKMYSTKPSKMSEAEKQDRNRQMKDDFMKLPEALKSNIYLYKLREMSGEITREEAMNLAAIDDWHLAKKQMTWFRRNTEIIWKSPDEIVEFVAKVIMDPAE
jgi:tRNA dimethylallyltransferase